MSETFTVGGKTIRLDDCFPVTIGNWEDLEEAGLISGSGELEAKGVKSILTIATTLFKNADPGVTRDDVRKLPLAEIQVLATELTTRMADSEKKEADRPVMEGDPT